MTKARAWKEAQLRWGKRAIIRHNPRALLQAEKEPLRARRKTVKAQLAAMPRSPETAAERGRLLREERELLGSVISNRCEVGEEMDILNAFHVMGTGDTWEAAAMSAQQFLQEARDTDRDIDFIDALLARAESEHAHPRVIARLFTVRNDKARHWARLWSTKPVTP